MAVTNKPADTDAYIASFSPELQLMLQQLRETIKAAAPGATEIISYGMPAYKQNGMVAWFACHTNHTGFYTRPSTLMAFKDELANTGGTKSTIHLPFDKPLPLELIFKIVRYQVDENLNKKPRKK